MTSVVFYKDLSNKYTGLSCSGHTGFGEFGSDILCASISAITQTAVLGIKNVVGVKNISLKKNDKNGYLKFELPQNLSDDIKLKCDLIIRVAYEGLKDLESGYSSFIKVEEKSNVY